MPDYRTVARDVREKVFAVPVHDTISGVADEVERRLGPEMAEIRRILGDQGDAADEVAEVLGRTLSRLADQVDLLASEVVRLRQRLDHVSDPAGNPAGNPAGDRPGAEPSGG